VRFESKPEQAIAMLIHAWEQGVPMRWVTGDEVYGDAPRLRETIQAHGRFYVLAVSANTRVWSERPEVEEPQEQTGGRPRLVPRVVQGAPPSEDGLRGGGELARSCLETASSDAGGERSHRVSLGAHAGGGKSGSAART